MRLALLVIAACGTPPTPLPPPPIAPIAPIAPMASCARDDGHDATQPADAPPVYRVTLATGATETLDAATPPLAGRVLARIEHGRLLVYRGRRIVLDADAAGAREVAWQVERDGVLFISLYGDDAQTYQALRLADAPQLTTVWCRGVPLDAGGTRGAFATANGPLLVRAPHALRAYRASDGELLWQLPRTDTGGPFTLLEAGATWIACDAGVTAIDRDRGTVRWTQDAPAHTATDCVLAGTRVLASPRRCGAKGCDRLGDRAIAIASGADTAELADRPTKPLVALAGDRELVATGGGVAIVDLQTGALGPTFAFDEVFSAEALPGGDVIVRSSHTARLATSPLSMRWDAPDAYTTRIGDTLLATRVEPSKGEAWLVEIAVATGAERVIALPSTAGTFEFGDALIIGSSATDVEVEVAFGYLE